ncbi:unnamed protein product, partial [Musa acuminata var. zebrina]
WGLIHRPRRCPPPSPGRRPPTTSATPPTPRSSTASPRRPCSEAALNTLPSLFPPIPQVPARCDRWQPLSRPGQELSRLRLDPTPSSANIVLQNCCEKQGFGCTPLVR